MTRHALRARQPRLGQAQPRAAPETAQELREAIGLSMDALWLKCGVSRDTISRIESGETIPGVHLLALRRWGDGV